MIPNLRFYLKRGDAYNIEFYQEKIFIPGSYYDENSGIRLCTFMNKSQEERPASISKIFSIRPSELYLNTFLQENTN